MVIIYTEKGAGQHDAVFAAGHSILDRDGVFESDDDIAVQAILDAYTLSDCKEFFKGRVDVKAKELRDDWAKDIAGAEMAQWATKKAEAKAYSVSKNPADVPGLVLEAAASGLSLDGLVTKVLANAAYFEQWEADVAGVAAKHKFQLDSAVDFDSVTGYDFSAFWPAVPAIK